MSAERKNVAFPFAVKGLDEKKRTFTGTASNWDVDLDEERFAKGAWKRSLDHWEKANEPVPLLDQHQTDSALDNTLGHATSLQETAAGLESEFYVDPDPKGDKLLRLIKNRTLRSLSVGYTPIKTAFETINGKKVRVIKEARLLEVSVVLWPANPGAQIDAVPVSVKSLLKAAGERDLTPEESEILEEAMQTTEEPEEEEQEQPEHDDTQDDQEDEEQVAPSEVTEIEKELAEAIAVKAQAIEDEDYHLAGIQKNRILGIEARLERAKVRLKRERKKNPTPDDPGRLASDARLASLRARMAAYR